MGFRTLLFSIAAMTCLLGNEAAAQQVRLETRLGLSVVTVEKCGKAKVNPIKQFGSFRRSESNCLIAGEGWDIGIQLTEGIAPITSVPTFRSLSIAEIGGLTDSQLQELLSKWLKSNLSERQRTANWSTARAKLQNIFKGSLSRGPYVCARYTHVSKHSKYALKAEAIGMRCARLSKSGKAIEEVAIQATAFVSTTSTPPKIFQRTAEEAIKSMRYKR
ncbi:hypothetical protein AXZ77_3741 [Thioclava sp. ES.031]|uniref:hypothetical protein n=1 Tax=Thioclava sp. ES.031 TaxID=1798203 RepID=UPI000C00CDD3|nr:hypothetical protein [Thioclava sp. ES.031]PFG65090.1 hypothetical protein AXZ77_3741 [Thioclava sp. ES.031]